VKIPIRQAAKYFANIIFVNEIGLVDNSSTVPVLYSSAKHRIVKAGIRIIKIKGAIRKNGWREATPFSIMLFAPGRTQIMVPLTIKKINITT